MAAPIVAGSAALVRQYFIEGWYPTGAAVSSSGFIPSGALIKAVLLGESTLPACELCYSLGNDCKARSRRQIHSLRHESKLEV